MGSFADLVAAQPKPKPPVAGDAPMFSFGGTGLNAPNLLPQLQPTERHGILGFFGNLLENAYDIGSGAVNLLLGTASDTAKLAAEAVTLGKAETGSYFIPQLATNIIPAIGHDLAKRYGGLMPWSFDLGRVANEFYDNPGFFAADAFMATGAAGKVAEAGMLGVKESPLVARALAGMGSKSAVGALEKAGIEGLTKSLVLKGTDAAEAATKAAETAATLSNKGLAEAAKAARVPIRTAPLAPNAAEALRALRAGELAGAEVPASLKALDWLTVPEKGASLLQDTNLEPSAVEAAIKELRVHHNPLTRQILKPLETGTIFGKELPAALRDWKLTDIADMLGAKTEELSALKAAGGQEETAAFKRLANEVDVLKAAAQRGAEVTYESGQRLKLARSKIANYIVSHRMASYQAGRNLALVSLDKLLKTMPDDPDFNPVEFLNIINGTKRGLLNYIKPSELNKRAQEFGFDSAQEAADALWDPAVRPDLRQVLMGDRAADLRRDLHRNQVAGKLDVNSEYVLYQPEDWMMNLPGRQQARQTLIDAGLPPAHRATVMKFLDTLAKTRNEDWIYKDMTPEELLARADLATREMATPVRGRTAEIGVTPFRPEEDLPEGTTAYTRVGETKPFFTGEKGKDFDKGLRETADQLGLRADAAPVKVTGVWEGSLEPSWQPHVTGPDVVVEEYAARMAQPHNQEGVLVFYPGAGEDVKWVIPLRSTRNASKAMEEFGISGGTIKGKNLEVTSVNHLGEDASAATLRAKVEALHQKYGAGELTEAAGESKLLGEGDYDAAITRGETFRASGRTDLLPQTAGELEAATRRAAEELDNLRYETDARKRGVPPEDRFYDRFNLGLEGEYTALSEDAGVQELFRKVPSRGPQPAKSRLDTVRDEINASLDADPELRKQLEQITARAKGNMDHFLFDEEGRVRRDIPNLTKIVHWYRYSKAALHEALAGQVVRLGDGTKVSASEFLTNLIAVTSNNVDPMNNLGLALDAFETYANKILPELADLRRSGLEPGTPEFAAAAEEIFMRHWPDDAKGMLPISKDGARDVFRGHLVNDWSKEEMLSKPKLTAFYQNLMGNFEAGTNDSIMRKAQYADPRMSTISGGGTLVGGGLDKAARDYLLEVKATSQRYADAINADIASPGGRKSYGGLRHVQPADIQAVAWVQYKRADAAWKRGWATSIEEAIAANDHGTIKGDRKAMLVQTWADKRMQDKGRFEVNEKDFNKSIKDLPEAEKAAAKADRQALKDATHRDLVRQGYDMLGAWRDVESPRFKGNMDAWLEARNNFASRSLKSQATRAERTGGDFGDFLAMEGKTSKKGVYTPGYADRIADLRSRGDFLFRQAADEILGVTQFGPQYGINVRLFRNFDLATFVHEMGHVIRRMMSPEERAAFAERYGLDADFWDADPDKLRAAEEAFADDLMSWYGPRAEHTPIVNQIFNKVKTWIRETWDANRSFLRERDALTPEQEAVFERWVGRGLDEMARPRNPRGIRPTEVARAVRQIAVRDDRNRPLPDGSFEPTVAGAPAELAQSAAQRRIPFGQMLREIFYPGYGRVRKVTEEDALHIRTRVKDAAAIEKAGGGADALGGRVTLGSWNEVGAMLDKLEAGVAERGGKIVSIEDGRGTAGSGGERIVRAYVQDAGGNISEVEFGTVAFDRVRDVTETRARLIDRHRAELAAAEQDVRNIQRDLQSDNPTHGQVDLQAAQAEVARLEQEVRDGEALMQQRWEGIADQIDRDVNGVERPGGASRDWYDEMRLWVDENIENPTIEYYGKRASNSLLLRRAYLGEAMKYGAEWDEDTMSFRYPEGVDGPSPWDLHMQRLNSGDVAPIYYPDMTLKDIKPSTWTMPHSLTNMRKRATNKFMKGSRGVIGEGRSTEIRDVYALRATAALKHLEAFHIVQDITTRLGRRIESSDDLLPGEKVFAPDGLLRWYGTQARLNDALIRAIDAGKGVDPEIMARDIFENVVKPTFLDHVRGINGVTTKGTELWAVPANVAEQVERYYRISGAEPSLRLFWDSWHKLWRGMVLAGSPRWIANNIFGNMVFGFMQGAHLSDVLRQLQVRIGKYEWTADPAFRGFLEDIVPPSQAEAVASGLFATEGPESLAHYGVASDTTTARIYKWMGERKPIVRLKTFGHYTRAINGAIEDAFRTSSYLRAAEREAMKTATVGAFRRFWLSKEDAQAIARNGITEASAKRFVDEVNYFFNDYNGLSNVERMYIRRFMMPFYSFYRHIASLIVRFPFDYTGKWYLMAQMAVFDKEMEADRGMLPDWLQGAMPLTDVRPNEATPYLMAAGPNPFNLLDTNSIISLLDPSFKVLAENAVGRNTFTGKEFTAPDVVETFGGKKFRVIRNSDGDVIGLEPVSKVSPGITEQVLQQVPQYTMLKDLLSGGKAYDTQSLARVALNAATGSPQPVTNYAGQPMAPTSPLQMFGKFMGINVIPYDVNAYQQSQQKAALEAYRAYLRQQQQTG